MPKNTVSHSKTETFASTVDRCRYKKASAAYIEFTKKFLSDMIIPFSMAEEYLFAICTLSRSFDKIMFCRVCKVFYRHSIKHLLHKEKHSDLTIKQMLGHYKIFTKDEMKNAINNFYEQFDATLIQENGWS